VGAQLVEIGGETYLIDTIYHDRDAAVSKCKSLNMNLVTFESAKKFEDISRWCSGITAILH